MGRITLVAGPPCSGKTTWAHENADVVLDWDELYAEVSGLPLYIQPPSFKSEVDALWNERRWAMTEGVIVRCAPRKQHRAIWRKTHRATIVVLAVPEDVCLERLDATDRPEDTKRRDRLYIPQWWMEYEPSIHDTVQS